MSRTSDRPYARGLGPALEEGTADPDQIASVVISLAVFVPVRSAVVGSRLGLGAGSSLPLRYVLGRGWSLLREDAMDVVPPGEEGRDLALAPAPADEAAWRPARTGGEGER